MMQRIENFEGEFGYKTIRWIYNGKKIEKHFKRPVFDAYNLLDRNEVLVIADFEEVGNRNLIIFDATGKKKATPKMPKLSKAVRGVYSIWYKEGVDQQITILLTEHFNPYDTKCIFDLNTYEFYDFSPSK